MEAEDTYGNDIFAITENDVKGKDDAWRQNMYVFFVVVNEEDGN